MSEQNIIRKEWHPNLRQTKFLSLPDTIFESLYGGAAGGGKSELLLMLPIARDFIRFPRFKGLYLRRTFPELEREVILRAPEFYAPCGGKYNESKKRWTFPSGAVIEFGHAEYERDIKKYDTAEYQYIAFDELTSFTQYQYLYMISRLRSGIEGLTPILRSGSNPGGVGHGWVRDRFVEPAPFGEKIIIDKITRQKRIFLQAKVTDNPIIMKRDPSYMDRMLALPEAERRAKMDGDWWTFSGQFFDEFRVSPFPDEPENARHVIEPFDIPSWWPRIMSIDWGFSAMAICGKYAISPWLWAVKYSEQHWFKTDISIWAADVARAAQHEKFVDIVIDPSAQQHRGDKSILEQFHNHSGLIARLGDNDRVSGAMLLREYLRWKEKPPSFTPKEGFSFENYNEILRRHGLEAAQSYKKIFEPQEVETNLPKLRMFPNCVQTIKAIPLCVHGEDTEDVAEFEGDDPYDETRYATKSIDTYLKHGARLAEKLLATQEIEQRLANTGDLTTYYHQMNLHEGKKTNLMTNEKKKTFGVQRRSRFSHV